MTDQTTHRGSGGGPQFEPAFLIRYVTGRATAVEADAVEAWLAADPARGRELEVLRRVWDASGHSFSEDEPYIIDQEWARLADMVHGSQSIPTASRRGLRGFPVTDRGMVALPNPWPQGVGGSSRGSGIRNRGSGWTVAVAAVLIVVLGAGLVVRWSPTPRFRSLAAPRHEYATAVGQRLSVTLVDGTQLTLAPASRVRLAADYGGQGRDVYLDGAAYFVVHHDAAHPFAVHTQSAVAEDVGTEFLVHAYPGDAHAQVGVAEGAVALHVARAGRGVRSPKVILLASGTLADVDSTGVTHLTPGVRVREYVGWREGGLIFRDTPVEDVARDITRWYGVDVVLDDPRLRSLKVTASFAGEPVDVVLHAVADALDTPYEWMGRSVHIGRSANRSTRENGH